MGFEVKNLSPHYKTISFVSPRTGLTCTKYRLEITIWIGLKTSAPIVPHFIISKDNVEDSIGDDKINISRLSRDFIDFTPTTDSGATQLIQSPNQAWVKTVVFYTTSDTTELTIPQLLDVQIMTKGYGYGSEGENPRFTSLVNFLMPDNTYKVDKNAGRFIAPIYVGAKSANLLAVQDVVTLFFQETLLDVLANDLLGWQPTNIIFLSFASIYDPSEYTIAIENNLLKFTSGTLPLATNLLLRSEELDNAAWIDNASMTVTADNVAAPNGTTTAEKIDYVNGGSDGTVAQNVTVVDATNHQLSIWMRGDVGGEKVRIDFKNSASTGSDGTNRTLTTDWVRYTENLTSTDTDRGFQIRCLTADAGNRTFFTWGAQIEQAVLQGDYISTTTAAAPTPTTADFFSRTFGYFISDSINSQSTGANVFLNIFALPTTVMAVDDFYIVSDSGVQNLMVQDNDVEGTAPTTITAIDQTGITSGTLAIDGTSEFIVFTPNGTVPAADETFTYDLTDTLATDVGTVTLRVTSSSGGGGDSSVNMQTTGSATGELSCDESLATLRFHNGLSSTPTLADIIFTDAGLTITFSGGDLYYKIPEGRSVKVNNSGVVTDLFICGQGSA